MPQTRVLHVLRAPVGGLFRHVRDLIACQASMGLQVGIVCDSSASDRLTAERLAALEPYLALGMNRVPMARSLGLSDVPAVSRIREIALRSGADILHGHGAKGGAYARLAAGALRSLSRDTKAYYTPHGGSLNYHPSTMQGRVYMTMERWLGRLTDGLIFESAWSARVYREQVGAPACNLKVVPNGLLPQDFQPHQPQSDAADFVFVGELRAVKGVDLMLTALAELRTERPVSAIIIGDGPDTEALKSQAGALGLLDGSVRFPGAMPAQKAFAQGRALVIPSRAESFPYIILEAAAAGIPLITTDVGGIPEIVAGTDTALLPPGDSGQLATALRFALEQPEEIAARAQRLRTSVADRFTVAGMTREIIEFYGLTLASSADMVPQLAPAH